MIEGEETWLSASLRYMAEQSESNTDELFCVQSENNYVEKFYFLISAIMQINMDRRMKHMEYEITDLQQLSKGRELLLRQSV